MQLELDLTPEQEAQLSRIAHYQGKDAKKLATDLLLCMIEDNERFLAAVQVGIDQADRGEFLSNDVIKGRIHQLLQP